jgi:hypothetical protein
LVDVFSALRLFVLGGLDNAGLERGCVFGFGFGIFSAFFHLFLSLLFRSQFPDLTGELDRFFHQTIFSFIFSLFHNRPLHPDPGRGLQAQLSNPILFQYYRRGILVMGKNCKNSMRDILKEVVLDNLRASRMNAIELSNVQTVAVVEDVVLGSSLGMGCPLFDCFGLHKVWRKVAVGEK